MIKRLLVSILILALAAILLAPSASGAAKKKFGSSIEISYSSDTSTFSGEVGSKVLRCERGRNVVVYAKPDEGERVELGSDRTDSKGRYEIVSPLLPVASYYAVVDRKATSSTVCLRAQTGRIAR